MIPLKRLLTIVSVVTIGQARVTVCEELPPRPNVIFIMADDLGYGDLGCYEQRLIKTPRIDQLAADGVRFTQAYAGSCVCAASRAVLMTGLHTGHAPVRDNVPHYSTYLQENDVTMAEILGAAGYRCGGVGKWSLGDAGTAGRPTMQGFSDWLGYYNQDHAHYYFPGYLDDGESRLELPDNLTTREHYSHDLMTERALRFIRDSKDGPFFLYAAYTVPHFSAREEDADRLPVPSDAPYSTRNWSRQEKNYAAMITRFDRDVGRIVDLVDQLGLRDNTLIIVTSDNGPGTLAPARFQSAGPLRGEKRSLYEGGVRVPMVMRWPGVIAKGRVVDEVISFQDFMPTLAALAGVDAPSELDGVSFADALGNGSTRRIPPPLYWDYGHCREQYDQAARIGDWKAVRNGRDGAIELYDLSNDVGETNNVAKENPEIVARFTDFMESAVTPSDRYPIGQIYDGAPIWKRSW